MRRGRWSVVLGLALVAASCDGGPEKTPATPTAGETLRVAFVYNGSITDDSWDEQHHTGELYLEEHLPNVETTHLDNIEYGSQARATLDDLAAQGYDLIISTAGYPNIFQVAEDYPETIFLTWGGSETRPNVGTYDVKAEEGQYLMGLLAGSVTKTDVIGYVNAFPFSQIVLDTNAFTLGAREVNPAVVVRTVFTNSWYDPSKSRQAADSLVDAGADILMDEQSSPGPASVADRRGVGFIGYGGDLSERAPDAWLGAFVYNWGPYYLAQTEAILDGTWKPTRFLSGLEDGLITLAPFGEGVPQDVIALITQREQAIANGTLNILEGPILDNSGDIRISAGETITDARLSCCDWFIEGVQGQLPAA